MKPDNRWQLSGRTDQGCVRSNNEDNFLLYEEVGLAAVADGMGGQNSGEVASALAVATMRDLAARLLAGEKQIVPPCTQPGLSARGRQLHHIIETANSVIFEKGRAYPKDAGMGTTVVAVLLDERSLTVAHVGDSRLYLYRQGALLQLTQDHSLVGDQLRHGLISAEAAARSNLQNILTRAVGAEPAVRIDVAEHPVVAGDRILLATDGLNKMVDDADIARALSADVAPRQAADTLVERARQAGGVDNITVICGRLAAQPRSGYWDKARGMLRL